MYKTYQHDRVENAACAAQKEDICRNRYKNPRGGRGFTLIEMLVVVLIIGILAAIALPQYRKAVYASKMAEVESVMNSIHQARKVHQMATGEAAPQDFTHLDVSLPADCAVYRYESSGRYMGWKCSKYVIYMLPSFTLATLWQMSGSCSYCHFDKIYPSGEYSCRESDKNSLFAQYCRSRGYPVGD